MHINFFTLCRGRHQAFARSFLEASEAQFLAACRRVTVSHLSEVQEGVLCAMAINTDLLYIRRTNFIAVVFVREQPYYAAA